jgi:hypothetical protein
MTLDRTSYFVESSSAGSLSVAKANHHTFRATGITAYLLNGGTIENAQANRCARKPADDETVRPDGRLLQGSKSG